MSENNQPIKYVYVDRPQRDGMSQIQKIILVLAIIYWISPIDAMPLIPIDDIFVMIAGVVASGVLGKDE